MAEIPVGALRFNVTDEGASGGPALILSNSLASNLSMWAPQVDALLAAGWRVIRYDNRGHGRSGIVDAMFGIEDMAEDIAGIMDTLGIDAAHFCGLSLGGMVGQAFAVRHPARLLSLTLCDTAAYMGPRELWAERIRAVTEGGMAAVVDATLERWFTAAGRARLPEAVAAVREGILATPVVGFCRACEAIRDMDLRDSIRRIATPTQVIVGEDDPGTPVAAARFIHERIEGSRLTVIPAAAHLANVEQSARFNEALLGFLGSHA